MKSEVRFLKKSKLPDFVAKIHQGPVFATVNRDHQSAYEKLSQDDYGQIVMAIAPPVESVKTFLFPARERVAVYPNAGPDSDGLSKLDEAQTVVGARACDLCALKSLDKIFLEQQVKDPFYEKRRQNTILITTDCVEPKDMCFCSLVGGKPYPEEGFDINISPLDNGYLVSSGSEKGEKMLAQAQELLSDPSEEQIHQRDQRRQQALAKIKEQNSEFETKVAPDKMVGKQPPEKWDKLSSACVECGACNFICPTCHCFFLYDQPRLESVDQNERKKSWDSCLLGNYAKMAGVGGMKPTPRPELRTRFENRIRHKFDWMPENIQLLGCVGCGRCIEACLAGLDIRDIFKEFGQ